MGSAPSVNLVRPRLVEAPPREWGPDVRALFADHEVRPGWRPWQVLGGPGTGKTALIADLAVHRLAAGADPESVLVLTANKRAARTLRDDIAERFLAGSPDGFGATREPLVRTIHSYAFAILRLQASVHGNPPPRLLTGAEHDAVIREMLLGELEDDDGAQWPQHLRGALNTYAFAATLRDLLARAKERGVGPELLVKLGKKFNRPEWTAAGKFSLRYEQAMLLRWSVGMAVPEASAPALDAAELVGAALSALLNDDELLRREQSRVRYLYIDDAQHLDPQAAELIETVGAGTHMTVVAGDPDQAVYGFRGADARFLSSLGDDDRTRRIVLTQSFRANDAITETLTSIASRFPGPARVPLEPLSTDAGVVRFGVLPSPAQEAAYVADVLRRERTTRQTDWRDMAVIVRSVPRSAITMRRALSAAGIPVRTHAADLPLPRQRAVSAILGVLRAIGEPNRITADDAIELVSGPIGGADAVALRRLRRGLRRADRKQHDSGELLRIAVLGHADELIAELTDNESAPLRRVQKVLAAGHAALAAEGGVEPVLWAVWRACGLESGWVRASIRQGVVADQANRDLDAMVALFDEAAAYTDRLLRPTLSGFVGFITAQEVPASPKDPAVVPDAVTLISAHAAGGREWDVVAVAGVEEGVWPNLQVRGSLLHTPEMLDVLDGTGDGSGTLSRMAPVLAEERRLFYSACSRARRTLVVTASESADQETMRSRFLAELLPDDVDPMRFDSRAERSLQGPALVGQLRRVVCDPTTDPQRREQAARHLARLAAAGAPGAHPDEWFGLANVSTRDPLGDSSQPIALSPSAVEQLIECPLRWVLQRVGGDKQGATAATTGTMVHTLVQALAEHQSPDEARRCLESAWSELDMGAGWYSRAELTRTAKMLENFAAWHQVTRTDLTLVAVEEPVKCEVGAEGPDDPDVLITGRIDRLEKDPLGRLVVVDIKTGKNPVSNDEAKSHAQLATYQLAIAEGGIEGGPQEPGGARLVYVSNSHNKDGATQREQPALDEFAAAQWRITVREAAKSTLGPTFRAVVSDKCRHCPVQNSCPAQDCGRQVGQ
ncbi:MAG: ATP-dependent helicase [Nocardiaceae bacterium]|nr:ATP-dependent helicase [Nocardiaceae bacterium]